MANPVIFGTMPDGRDVHQVTLRADDLEVDLLTLGVTLRALRFHGRNLTLGFDSVEAYLAPGHSAGGICGPVVNRIGGAQATLDGVTYRFDAGPGGNTLHSGATGTHLQVWTLESTDETTARFTITLPDGQGGFPGNRKITATYGVSADQLSLELAAETDAPTWINLAQHAYWNLSGAETYLGHGLEIHAARYLPTENSLPSAPRPVAGTQFDFRQPTVWDTQRVDHNYCLEGEGLRWAARLSSEDMGMEMHSDAPGLQIYDGFFLNHPPHGAQAGLAMEAQHWPNAMHNPEFPNTVVRPGETYRQSTFWRFFQK